MDIEMDIDMGLTEEDLIIPEVDTIPESTLSVGVQFTVFRRRTDLLTSLYNILAHSTLRTIPPTQTLSRLFPRKFIFVAWII